MAYSPTIAVVVVAAGNGTRLGHALPKAFVELAGRSILSRSLDPVFALPEAAQLIVVAPPSLLGEAESIVAEAARSASGSCVVVAGGETRQSSVAAGLSALGDSVEVVLVHDAARAFAPAVLFERVVAAVRESGRGAIPALPVSDTIKRVDADATILDTVDRSELAAVQTPQGFPRAELVDAYASATAEYTDDAALIAAAGGTVAIVPGDELAFKITTPWDLRRAEQLLADGAPGLSAAMLSEALLSAAMPRIGVGFDSHVFDATQPLWLAGLHWPGEAGLAGHSDGDAVAHALCDAILSAAGLGDLGSVFGTEDPRFAEARGEVFIAETVRLATAAGFRIGNVTVQLIANRPRFAARRTEAESLLTRLVGCPVSVSATTTDGLGFAGRGEGAAVIATAVVFTVGGQPSPPA